MPPPDAALLGTAGVASTTARVGRVRRRVRYNEDAPKARRTCPVEAPAAVELRYAGVAAPAPRARWYNGYADITRVCEYEWRPEDGVAAAGAVADAVPSWLLRSTALPIILTMALRHGQWLPWTVTAESFALSGAPPQHALYPLRPFKAGDLIVQLLGDRVGRFRAGSAALHRVAARHNAGGGHGYLFETREHGGYVTLWNGATDRAGGARSANDAHGTGLRTNAAIGVDCDDIDEDTRLRATRAIEPLRRDTSRGEMAALEVLWDYGDESFWRADGAAAV